MADLTHEQAAELDRITAASEALRLDVAAGRVTIIEAVQRAAEHEQAMSRLHARVVDQIVARTEIPDFPPADPSQ